MGFQFQIFLNNIPGVLTRSCPPFIRSFLDDLDYRGFESGAKWFFGFEVKVLLRGEIVVSTRPVKMLLHFTPRKEMS